MGFFDKLKRLRLREKVVVYYRVSKKSNAMHLRQVFVCEEYVKEHGYEKDSEFYEVISGTVNLDERTELVNCIVYCIKNGIKTIILSEVDRLSRNINTFDDIMKMVEPFNIKFKFVLDKLNTSGSANIEKVRERVEFAEKEVRKIHNRLDTGRKKFIANGGKLGRKTGSVKTKEQKKEEYPDVLRLLFNERKSVREIERETGVSRSTIQRLKNEFKNEYREVVFAESQLN